MPRIAYYLRTGATVWEDTDEDFDRLRDRIEGYVDCHESIVIERVETERLSGSQKRVALIIPAEVLGPIRIEEPIHAKEEGRSAMQHVDLP